MTAPAMWRPIVRHAADVRVGAKLEAGVAGAPPFGEAAIVIAHRAWWRAPKRARPAPRLAVAVEARQCIPTPHDTRLLMAVLEHGDAVAVILERAADLHRALAALAGVPARDGTP